MDLLFIVDPLAELKAYKDSTVAMLRAAQRAGHALHACEPAGIVWAENEIRARYVPLRVHADDTRWFDAGESAERALRGFDAVLMRKDPPLDAEYITCTWLLSAAEREGARVFNHPAALRDHNEKLAIAEFSRFTTPTLVSRLAGDLQAFIDRERDVILKRLDGMGGASIFRVRHDDPNRNVIIETLSDEGRRTIMAQRYIPQIVEGDKRILLIDGEPLPYALARIPAAGETRGNLAAGGRGIAQPLSHRDRDIATSLGPILARRGLLLVGLDVIGDFLTEVNVTSPTCFREIQEQTGFDVAGRFISALEARVRSAA